MSYKEDELYLQQIFKPIGKLYFNIVKLIYQTIQFFIKKVWLFLALIVVGLVAGYFLDQKNGIEIIKQEVIIEPKVNSIRYIYNLIDEFPQRKSDEKYLESLGIKKEWLGNIKSVKIEPIVAIEDIFDYLHREYQDKNFQYSIQDFSPKAMNSEKFTYFYKYHIVRIFFNKKETYNEKISESILNSASNNEHYVKELDLSIKQAREAIKNNEASLKYIDDYLTKIVQKSNDNNENDKLVIVSNENETNKVASLLEQKSKIMSAIKTDQIAINLNNKVFSVVGDSKVLTSKKPFYSRTIFFFPLLLCLLVCLIYFTIYLFGQIKIVTKKRIS